MTCDNRLNLDWKSNSVISVYSQQVALRPAFKYKMSANKSHSQKTVGLGLFLGKILSEHVSNRMIVI